VQPKLRHRFFSEGQASKESSEDKKLEEEIEASVGVEFFCARCYTRGKVRATLTLEDDFDVSKTVETVEDSISDTIDQIKTWIGDVDVHLSEFEVDIPAPNITFDIDLDAFPGTILEFQFDGVEIFVELDITLGSNLSYKLNLFKSTQLGMELDEDLFLGLVFSIDLFLSVDSEITITSGFHLLLEDGVLIRLALFAKEASDTKL
jgi:hypothetical protein